jgi:hypothetical protein
MLPTLCSLVYKAVQAPEYQSFLHQALKAPGSKSNDPNRPFAGKPPAAEHTVLSGLL